MSAAAPNTLHSSAIQTNSHPSTVVPFPESKSDGSTPRAAGENDDAGKKKKRSLFGFGKKKTEEPQMAAGTSAPRDSPPRRSAGSPTPADRRGKIPTSPPRALSTSPRLSPRLGSPAGSQIFERDVQEAAATLPTSPAIPSHITTEDFIPPVLDASSEAITDDRIDPDSVEIVTHSSHQPASAAVVAGQQLQHQMRQSAPSLHEQGGPAASWAEQLASFEHAGPAVANADSASNYGSLDATDIRRLSFISFADVVQSEQSGHGHGSHGSHGPGPSASRDSMHLAGLTSLSALGGRSPSPIRSPVSSQGGALSSSPPTSNPGSIRGLETSPTRKPAGGPLSPGSPPPGMTLTTDGELKIETMSQALRRTGSTDLGGVRSLPQSPIEGPSR